MLTLPKLSCIPTHRIPVDIPQVLTLNPEVPLKGLVGRVHRGALDSLRRS
jgi:hypothetical protein